MKVLLSIKPEFTKKIFEGEKLYEFRRIIFKKDNISKIIVYASSPIKKVIGEIEIEYILKIDKNLLWGIAGKYSGITKKYYDAYFKDLDFAYAIKIKKAKKYRKQLCLKKDFNINTPPQSFLYLYNQ